MRTIKHAAAVLDLDMVRCAVALAPHTADAEVIDLTADQLAELVRRRLAMNPKESHEANRSTPPMAAGS